MKNEFMYFVSYTGSGVLGGSVFGHGIIGMDRELECVEALEDLQKALEVDTGLKRIVILFFKLIK